jgi:ribonucleoside-diphosphate reductase alpha chain
MEHIDSYQIETTNPCGEQPLPKHGACGLCSINLSEYILDPFTNDAKFDIESFAHDIYYIVEAMDDIVQENLPNHALDEQRDVATRFRNLGIGVMGIQDMLIKLGLTYGSEESLVSLNKIMKFVAQEAVLASAKLAETRGAFTEYSDIIFKSQFFKNLGLREECFPHGLRNSTLLSVAPTGSIGTMLNISSGVEPWFAMHYTRNTKSLEGKEMSHEVWAPIAEEARKRNWHPETLVTSNDISWKEHIDVQAVVQAWVDTAVSKTINMPKGTTPEEVKQAYIYAWNKGLKGLTVYVDGSRDPILTTDNSKPSTSIELDYITPVSRDTFGEVLIGHTFKKKTACGTLYITINKDEQGNIVEIFTNSSKNGTCKANLNGETRMASLALRAGVKVDEVVDQLKGIHCQSCAFARAKGNQVDGTSCPDIMAKCIKEACSKHKPVEDTSEKCPECGKPVRHEGGCVVCDCGFSKCG